MRRSKIDSPQSPWAKWQKKRHLRHESKNLLAEARRLLRKQRNRLKPEILESVEHAVAELSGALKENQVDRLCDLIERLDDLLEKNLSFARKSATREYIESIGFAVLIALLLRAFVVEAFKIPSGSMIPTLKVGDHLFVNKFIYGLRIPWTNLKFFARTPQRGDVIVFVYPKDPDKDFIKRIVALGGDTVEVRDGVVIVNDKPVPRKTVAQNCSYLDTEEGSDRAEVRDCVAFDETVPGHEYRVIQDPDGLSATDYPPTKIPPGQVFVMGDNRDNSHDSRFWGTVPEGQIKGKALIIWWSKGAPEGVRWGRFFDLVHAAPRPE